MYDKLTEFKGNGFNIFFLPFTINDYDTQLILGSLSNYCRCFKCKNFKTNCILIEKK